jgi:glyoxylase-like metal-dependent hydrolase (beta-lactamase superfamily II)
MNKMDRRAFVQRTGLTGLSLLTLSLGVNRTFADPDPPVGSSAATGPVTDPDIYSFKIGDTEAFVIHDGFLSMPAIQPMFVPEAKPEELQELLKKNFLPADSFAVSLNVLVIKDSAGVSIFDSGAGSAFGSAMGKLIRGLAKVGVTPADVKTIYVTHGHGDHIGGLVNDANQPVFSSAKIIVPKHELEFWTAEHPDLSGMRTTDETKTQTAASAKKIFDAIKSQLVLKGPGEVAPGVELISAPGHTPGHAMYRVTRGSDKVLVIGDIVHVFAAQFPHPEWTMAYDVNPALAIETRRKAFKQLAADRTLVLGYHMPFPGLGHVRAEGQGFEWVPKPWVG